MKTRQHPLSPIYLARALAILRGGGVIAYPTEGVWGLGCDPFDGRAVERILELKQRPVEKGLILIAADIAQLYGATGSLKKAELDQLSAPSRVPCTWLIPHNGALPDWITGSSSRLAVRLSTHPLVALLCNAFGGAIVSTSANPGGRPAARSALRVRQYFDGHIDMLVPGELGGFHGASEIRDLTTGKLIRTGGS